MEALVLALARRYRVVILSNTNAAHIDHIRANYRVLGHAHAAYLSRELRLAKPRAEAFEKVLGLEGLRPKNASSLTTAPTTRPPRRRSACAL